MPKLAIMTGRKKAKFSPKLTALYLLLLEVGAARSCARKRRIILALTNTSKIDEMFIHYGPNNGGRSGRPALQEREQLIEMMNDRVRFQFFYRTVEKSKTDSDARDAGIARACDVVDRVA